LTILKPNELHCNSCRLIPLYYFWLFNEIWLSY
jgi:hypothetical protein